MSLFKIFLSLLVVVPSVLLAGPATVVSADNLVVNSSFEDIDARDTYIIADAMRWEPQDVVVIVDNTEGAASATTWGTSSWASHHYGTDYRYHQSSSGGETFRWDPGVFTAGEYEVLTLWSEDPSRAPDATYNIHHTGGIATVAVDQQSNGGGWVSLGTYSFDGLEDYVELVANPNGYVIADAVKWIPADKTIIIDNQDPLFSGAWPTDIWADGYYGTNYQFHLTGDGSTSVTWHPTFQRSGEYRVFARWTEDPSRSSRVPYEIHHASGTDTVIVNQKFQGGVWRPLGDFSFDIGTAGYVRMTDGAEQDSLPTAWSSVDRTYANVTSETAYTGEKSLRLDVAEPAGNVFVKQSIPVEGGKSYTFGTWIKTEDVQGFGAYVAVQFAGGNLLGADVGVAGTTDWHYLTFGPVTAPADATSADVKLVMEGGSHGNAWFDGVSFEPYTAPLLSSRMVYPGYRGKILPNSASPEIEIDIDLNPQDYGHNLDELEALAVLKDESGTVIKEIILENITDDSIKVLLDVPDDTPPGDYTLDITLLKEDIPVSEESLDIQKVSESNLNTYSSYIDEYNRLIVNGEPFFPLGLYVAQCPNKPGHFPQLDEIEKSPFDTLMNYCVHSCDERRDVTDSQIDTYLGILHEKDLKLIFPMREFINHGQDDFDDITHMIDTFGNDPTIISWYMNDELGLEYLPELESRYRFVKEMDPNHPIWSVHWRQDALEGEVHTTDVLGVDPYPVPRHPITMVSEWAEWAREASQGAKPFWLVPQLFERSERMPTKEEMRAMTYLALNHGAKGLIYYAYFELLDDEYSPIPSVDQWQEIKDVAGEVQSLKPVLLSTEEMVTGDVISSEVEMDYALRKEGDTYYLFAVNTSDAEISDVIFDIDLPFIPCSVEVLFEEGQSVAVEGGLLVDNFEPYAVHVYRWADRCCLWDFTCDGDFSEDDLAGFTEHFGATAFDGPIIPQGDSEGDGDVDGADLAALVEQYVEW